MRPARQCVAESIPHRRHWRDDLAIDPKRAAGGIHAITRPRDEGLDDVPILSVMPRPRLDVRSHWHGDAEFDKLSNRRHGVAADVKVEALRLERDIHQYMVDTIQLDFTDKNPLTMDWDTVGIQMIDTLYEDAYRMLGGE
jgi:hypothetical protein